MATPYPLTLNLDDIVWDSERPSAVYEISDRDTIPSPPPDFTNSEEVKIPLNAPIPWFKE